MKQTLTLGKIPLRNLRAHPVRTVTLMLLAMAQAACVFGGLMMTQSMRHEMALTETRLGADILVYPSAAMSRISSKTLLMQGSPVEVWKDRSLLKRMQDCDGIEKVAYQTYIRDTTEGIPIWIVGFDPAEDFVITPWMEDDDLSQLADGAVLAGCDVMGENGAVTLFGQSWPIASRLTETGSELDGMVFVSMTTLGQLTEAAKAVGVSAYSAIDPQNDFTVALVKVRNKEDLDSVTSWLNVYLRKVKAVRSEAALTDTASGIHGQIGMTVLIAVAAWAVLLLALGIAQSLMMKERKKELYLWHTIGANRFLVNTVMSREALLIHGTGAALGVIIASAALRLLRQTVFSLPFALLTVFLTILGGWISTLLAVRRATESLNGQMLLTV